MPTVTTALGAISDDAAGVAALVVMQSGDRPGARGSRIWRDARARIAIDLQPVTHVVMQNRPDRGSTVTDVVMQNWNP